MKKWLKGILFLLPILLFVAWVNWYIDSYAYLRVTYDRMAEQMMEEERHVLGLEESNFNDRNLLLACMRTLPEPENMMVLGSSRVLSFDHTMFGEEKFYNAGLSEATFYDLLAVTGILVKEEKLPKKMIIGVDSFLFNSSTNNEKWRELEDYEKYMEEVLSDENTVWHGREKNTGLEPGKYLSLDYFRYNVTLLPKKERFSVSYVSDWDNAMYCKHCDGSISYQETLRNVSEQEVIDLTEQAIDEKVVYRMTGYEKIDEQTLMMFKQLLQYLKDQGVEVILYLPPYSPMMYDYIGSEEAYRITCEVEEEVKKVSLELGIDLYGSYDPKPCKLEMTDLYDIYHVKSEKMPDTFYPVIIN